MLYTKDIGEKAQCKGGVACEVVVKHWTLFPVTCITEQLKALGQDVHDRFRDTASQKRSILPADPIPDPYRIPFNFC
jgi:hypothetical protein